MCQCWSCFVCISMNRNWRMFKNSYECHTEICTAVKLRYTQPHFLSKSKTGTKSRKHSKGRHMRVFSTQLNENGNTYEEVCWKIYLFIRWSLQTISVTDLTGHHTARSFKESVSPPAGSRSWRIKAQITGKTSPVLPFGFFMLRGPKTLQISTQNWEGGGRSNFLATAVLEEENIICMFSFEPLVLI